MINIKIFSKVVAWVTLASVFGNMILAIVGRVVSMPPETFAPYMYSNVIGLTVGGVFAAAAVYYFMRRKYADAVRADRHFLILSIIVLFGSFYPDVVIPWETDPDDVGWTYGIIANLMLMHIVAGGLVMYYFTRKKII